METMSRAELDDTVRSTQEQLRQLLNEQHRRALGAEPPGQSSVGTVARQAALHALRGESKSVLAFAAIVVIMVGVALANAMKALGGP